MHAQVQPHAISVSFSHPSALSAGYLFPEIGRRRSAYLEKNPDAKVRALVEFIT